MAIDYGQKFTGLAIYKCAEDPFPLPFDRIAYKNDEQLIEGIKRVIDDEVIDKLVVGIPRFTDGTESTMTKTVRSFFDKLTSSVAPMEVYEQDETLSTQDAKNRMLNSPKYNFKIDLQKIDALSAAIILEDFMQNSKID